MAQFNPSSLAPSMPCSSPRFWRVLYIDDVDEKHSERILESAVADFPVPVVFNVVSNCFLALERVEMTNFDAIMVKSNLEFFGAEEFIKVVANIGINSSIILMVPTQMKTPKALRHSPHISSVLKSPFSFQTLRSALMNALPGGLETFMASQSLSPLSPPPQLSAPPSETQVISPVMIPSPPSTLLEAVVKQQSPHKPKAKSDSKSRHSSARGRYSDDVERKLLASTHDFCAEDLSLRYACEIISSASSDTDMASSPRLSLSDLSDFSTRRDISCPVHTVLASRSEDSASLFSYRSGSTSGSYSLPFTSPGMVPTCHQNQGPPSAAPVLASVPVSMDVDEVEFMANIPWEQIFV